MNDAQKWRVGVSLALAAGVGQQFTFTNWFTVPDEHNQKFFDHNGKSGKLAGVINTSGELYDDEALPFFQVEFDGGVILDVQVDEITPDTEAGQALVDLVVHGYRHARDLGYSSVSALEEHGSPEHLALFGQACAA